MAIKKKIVKNVSNMAMVVYHYSVMKEHFFQISFFNRRDLKGHVTSLSENGDIFFFSNQRRKKTTVLDRKLHGNAE